MTDLRCSCGREGCDHSMHTRDQGSLPSALDEFFAAKKPTGITVPRNIPAEMGMWGGNGASIEASERQGGQEMLSACVLPVVGSDAPGLDKIQWGEIVIGDDLFRYAELPPGWKRIDGQHPAGYWTYLHDEDGNQHAAIFYKAAFYDRRAEIYHRFVSREELEAQERTVHGE